MNSLSQKIQSLRDYAWIKSINCYFLLFSLEIYYNHQFHASTNQGMLVVKRNNFERKYYEFFVSRMHSMIELEYKIPHDTYYKDVHVKLLTFPQYSIWINMLIHGLRNMSKWYVNLEMRECELHSSNLVSKVTNYNTIGAHLQHDIIIIGLAYPNINARAWRT